ncbi:MAG: F0F1 ATP synthase subunit delta [Segetibacter sp.]
MKVTKKCSIPRLAGRYAKSLIDLAVERNYLEEVYKDMLYLQAVCKASREFVVLLKSPVIPIDKKKQGFDSRDCRKNF